MDIIWELVKSGLVFVFIGVLILAIPALFMFVFSIATDLDEHMQK